jgi:drug/metabolite transporter (DMT)-like permease
MKLENKIYLYTFFVILMWSTIPSAFKLTLKNVDPINMLFYTSGISLFIFLIIIIGQNNQEYLKSFTKKDYLFSSFLGALNPFIYYIILFEVYRLLPAQEAQPINLIWTILIPFLSWIILKQKIQIKNIFALIISFFGVFILVSHGNFFSLVFSNTFGIFLGIFSAIIWGTFWVYNIKDERKDILKLFLNFFFGFIYITIYLLIVSTITMPSLQSLIGLIYIGAFEMGITFLLWLKIIELSENTAKITNLILLVPFISLIFISLIIGEKILWSSIMGLIFIILGILIQKQNKKI